MADVAGYHGGDGAKPTKRRSSGKNLNLYDKFQKNGSRPLPIEFDYSSNLYRAVGENYQLFIRLISNKVDRHATFHYRSWQEVPGDVKMYILTTLHISRRYTYGPNKLNKFGPIYIERPLFADYANQYKDRKTKLKKHFDKEGGSDNTTRAKQNPPKGMDPEDWVQLTDHPYGSYRGTQSYVQRRYDEVKEGGVPQHVEGRRDMHFKGSSGWYNQLAEQHWDG
ncbi:hypothetical protein R6Q57_007082 [Mikania cordata]